MVSFNTIVNLYCKEGRLDNAYKLLYEAEKKGLESDKYTHTILIDGLCRTGNFKEAKQHLDYTTLMGFDSNLVALNSFINGLCKAGHLDHALRMFESMDVKDSITYSTMVHSLCKARRFRAASKLLLSCIRGGLRILKSDKRGVIDGLRSSGYSQEARKVQSKILLAKILQN